MLVISKPEIVFHFFFKFNNNNKITELNSARRDVLPIEIHQKKKERKNKNKNERANELSGIFFENVEFKLFLFKPM